MKKLTALLLVLMLALAMVPNMALATTRTVNSSPELAAAIADAASGDTIILNDATYTISGSIPKNLTFKGVSTAARIDLGNVANSAVGLDLVFDNLTLVRPTNQTFNGFHHVNTETYINCIIEGQYFTYGVASFTGCTFNTTDASNYNIWTYGSTSVTFDKCTFNCAGKSILVYNEGGNGTAVTVKNCTLTNTTGAPVVGKAAIEIDSQYLSSAEVEVFSIVVTNSTATGFAAGSVSGNTLWNNKLGNLTEVTVDGVNFLGAGGDTNTVVTATVNPTYIIIIPAEVNFGTLVKNTGFKEKAFYVKAQNVALEPGAKIEVKVTSALKMYDNNGAGTNELAYVLKNNNTAADPVVGQGDIYATFNENTTTAKPLLENIGNVTVNTADIGYAGAYKGVMTFTIAYVTTTP